MSKKTINMLLVVLGVAVLAALIYFRMTGFPGPQRQLRELDTNAQTWQSQGITHYRMKVGIGCFCPFYDRMPVTVEVLDGKVLSVTDSQGQPVPEDDAIRLSGNERLMTIEGVFGYAREAIENADETKVDFDPRLGFPVRLSIDEIKLAMDDELSVVVSELQVLP